MIVSSIPGRIRLRADAFKDPDLPLDDLARCPGVIDYVMNTLTGSLLVEYDPETLDPAGAVRLLNRLDPGALQQYAEYIQKKGLDPASLFSGKRAASPARATAAAGPEPPEGSPPGTGRERGSEAELWNEVVGFGISLAALAVSGFLGARKIHVMAGMFLIEVAAKHAWRYRKRIRPPKRPPLGDFLLPRREGGCRLPPEAPGPEEGPAFLC
ncbi:MAG: hypothetical protein LBR80_17440 [Deltaproteobacteria bacterium]|nr:hypothetical protein [Deltaproteobacteria bacterium]